MTTQDNKTPSDRFAQNETNHLTMYVTNPGDGRSLGIIITKHRPDEYEKRDYRMIRRLMFPGVTLHVLVAGKPLPDVVISSLAASAVDPETLKLTIDLRPLAMDPRTYPTWVERNGKYKK